MMIETQTRQLATRENAASVSKSEARWCPECAATTVMVTPESGLLIAGVSARAVYRLVESGRVHFAETEEGAVLVCLSSLANYETRELRRL